MGSLVDCTKSNSLQKNKENKLDKFDESIFKAKLARDQVKSYLKRMENQFNKQKQLAKEHLKQGNREKAKISLSRSKAYEVQIDSGQGQLNMLEQQIIQIDQAKSEVGALKALEQGNTLLKQLQSEISVDKWEKVADDMADARESKRELDEFFQRHNITSEEHEEDINNEIEKLLKAEGKVIENDLPNVPIKKEIEEKDDEEENKEKEDNRLKELS